jgi:hypothetical protein
MLSGQSFEFRERRYFPFDISSPSDLRGCRQQQDALRPISASSGGQTILRTAD